MAFSSVRHGELPHEVDRAEDVKDPGVVAVGEEVKVIPDGVEVVMKEKFIGDVDELPCIKLFVLLFRLKLLAFSLKALLPSL